MEKWYWRPAAIVSYSTGRFAGARRSRLAEPAGESGAALIRAFPRFADDLEWWSQAAKAQRDRVPPPY